jgi:hypothetical protein
MTSLNTTGLNLLISDKADDERDAVAVAFSRGGGTVHRLIKFWEPPALDPATVRVYGADSFCLVLQQKLGFGLCSPADDLILRVPPEFLQRKLSRQTLAEALQSLPAFVKPITPKQFRGAVYHVAAELAAECRGLPLATSVLVSEPVNLTTEVRSFVLDDHVLDAAAYAGDANGTEATAFIDQLVRTITLPASVVVDVGLIAGRGWVVVEFNAAWGAGLNGCDASKVLPAIVAASRPKTD